MYVQGRAACCVRLRFGSEFSRQSRPFHQKRTPPSERASKTVPGNGVADFPNAIAMRIHTHPKWPILPKIAFTAGFNCLPMITNRRDRPISKIRRRSDTIQKPQIPNLPSASAESHVAASYLVLRLPQYPWNNPYLQGTVL